MKITDTSGWSFTSSSASSRPVPCGITTSVSNTSSVTGVASRQPERRDRVCGFQHDVAVRDQGALQQRSQRGVVLHEEDRARARARLGRLRGRRGDRARAGEAREVDAERRAAAEVALQADEAAALRDDPEDARQPEPSSVTGHLRGEEGLEDSLLDLLIHSRAGVRDAERDPLAGGIALAPTSIASSTSRFAVSIVSVPPRGIASRALVARFRTTCSICVRSASTCPRASAKRKRSSTSSPTSGRSISSVWRTTSSSRSGSGFII